MNDVPGFCLIDRARVRPDKEQQYVAAWSRLTQGLRAERGALGSRLHHGADGLWYAYAQWPRAEARAAAFALPSVDPQADADVADAIVEYVPEIAPEPVEDQLACVSGMGASAPAP